MGGEADCIGSLCDCAHNFDLDARRTILATGGVPMSALVLVAYATRGGSTGEVAQAIGAALEEAGVTAEVLPVSEVESLAGKTAVILGAPLYIGSFPREFHQF